MRLYFELARKAAQRQLAYRQANLAGLLTNLFFGALRAYVLIALYGTRPEIAGYTLSAAVTYTGLTQAALRAVQIFGWLDLMKTVRSGDMVSDLSKPFDYYFFWLAQDLGADVVHLIVRGVPIMLAYALATPLVWPASLGAALMVMFTQVRALGGWSFGEIAFLYELSSVTSLHELFQGAFDNDVFQMLIRPLPTVFQMLAEFFLLRRLGRMTQGLITFALGAMLAQPHWTLTKLIYLPVVVAEGALFFLAISITGCALCFWTVQSTEVVNI